MPHPYRRHRPHLPEVGISEAGNIRSLHLGTNTIQSSMNLDYPEQLVLSYSRAMMAWLFFVDTLPEHITQIGLGGGSFARWIDAYLPQTKQTAVEINPQVINIARAMFELPEENARFEIVEADGAQYIKTVRGGTDIILTDGFDGEQIIDDLVSEEFFADCKQALSDQGIFVSNWWSGDKRYPEFIAQLKMVFEQIIEIPAESHGNMAVFGLKQGKDWSLEAMKKQVHSLSQQYGLDFGRMLADIKAHNHHNGKFLKRGG